MADGPSTAEGDHRSTSHALLAVVLLEFSLGTIIMLLRTYTKFYLQKDTEKWSYSWATLTWTTGLINCTAIALSVSYGLGKHIDTLSLPAKIDALRWSWVSDGTSRFATAFGRVAVASFIYGIQGPLAARWRKILLWCVAISNLVLNTFIVFILFFRCSPPSYIWNKTIPGGKCPLEHFNQVAAYAILGYGGATDLLLACYPISIISRLQMRTRNKVTLSILFGFGLFACLCAAMTSWELHTITNTEDPTYVLTPVAIWAVTEIWAILIASSAPPLYPLLKRFLPSRRRSSATSQEPIVHQRPRPMNPLDTDDDKSMSITVVRDIDVSTIDKQSDEEKQSRDIFVV